MRGLVRSTPKLSQSEQGYPSHSERSDAFFTLPAPFHARARTSSRNNSCPCCSCWGRRVSVSTRQAGRRQKAARTDRPLCTFAKTSYNCCSLYRSIFSCNKPSGVEVWGPHSWFRFRPLSSEPRGPLRGWCCRGHIARLFLGVKTGEVIDQKLETVI